MVYLFKFTKELRLFVVDKGTNWVPKCRAYVINFNARTVTAFTYGIRDLKRKFIINFILVAKIFMNTNTTNHR